ncbi:hypothetical protein N7447_008314 [Penicillium robsamsonii]|uniref:uncharacterized protein n=1 Tax=Penicillium robsamsonii TaxID=1792511 RepID=UPI0025475D52|nr:uncharacterized protein N7447_008314 [Penicillium robsamsonii]KAJ5816081.1 hypothetical protein N7447_008314 [Penicillium robsamsonii]
MPTTPPTTPPAIAPVLVCDELPELLDPTFAVDEDEGDDEDVAVEVKTGVPMHHYMSIFNMQARCAFN